MSNFYITTTLPYVNSDPHLGFAKEIINADIIARHRRQLGDNVFFNTGTDEHGQKIYQKAKELGIDVIDYATTYSNKFLELKNSLNLSFNNFIRTTDKHHIEAAQKFWQLCYSNGDIYKKNYKIKYCVGCEMEKTDSELDHGVCPFHPNGTVEEINEENYFFRFSKFQKPLLDFYKNNPDFVKPKHRFNEIIKFIEGGLNDFSISRLKEKMPWGVPIPDDDYQVMYVWFDALVNYISCLGWPDNLKNFNDFWPATQVCGKDNLRPQTAMWPSLLLSAGLQLPKEVLVFGFLTLNGKKMSKSSNNIIDLTELINKYGSDSVRYYLAKEISTFEDGDFSYEKLEKLYTSDLVNGLGNLVSRVSNLIEKNDIKVNLPKIVFSNNTPLLKKISNEYDKFLTVMSEYKLNEALEIINSKIKKTDEFLSEKAPWKMSDKKEINEVLQKAAENILEISILIWPIIPQAANGIILQFTAEKIIKKEILFPKLLNN